MLRRVGKNHEVKFALDVVDHGKLFGAHQQNVRGAQGVRLVDGGGEPLFYELHRLVAEVPDQSTREARQAGQRSGLEFCEIVAHEHKGIGVRETLHALFAVGTATMDGNIRAARFNAL